MTVTEEAGLQHSTEGAERRRFLARSISLLGAASLGRESSAAAWSLLADTKACNQEIDVDIGDIEPGARLDVDWCGFPVSIIHRTEAMLASLETLEPGLLDPQSAAPQQPDTCRNRSRSIMPQYGVYVGICTYLTCYLTYTPAKPEWKGLWSADFKGFYCACHGSRYDLAGRVLQGVPSKLNLVVPPHRYVSDRVIRIGPGTAEA